MPYKVKWTESCVVETTQTPMHVQFYVYIQVGENVQEHIGSIYC